MIPNAVGWGRVEPRRPLVQQRVASPHPKWDAPGGILFRLRGCRRCGCDQGYDPDERDYKGLLCGRTEAEVARELETK